MELGEIVKVTLKGIDVARGGGCGGGTFKSGLEDPRGKVRRPWGGAQKT